MYIDFIPFCSDTNKRLLFYFGVALNCNAGVLEAIFLTSLATTAVDTTNWQSLSARLMIEMIMKIDFQHCQHFEFGEHVDFRWDFPKGRLTLRSNEGKHYVSLVATQPAMETRPFLTIYLHPNVLYSTETEKPVLIPFGQIEKLIDVHVQRLGDALK